MATPGQLDIAGMLYEGNWVEWYPCMMALLEYNELGHCLQLADEKLPWQHEGALPLVKRMECKNLVTRTANPYRTLPRLLDVLEDVAIPFRFMGLPAELRNKIYLLVLLKEAEFSDDVRNRFLPPATPTISQVSVQIRKEADSFYYAETVFRVRPWEFVRGTFVRRMPATSAAGSAR